MKSDVLALVALLSNGQADPTLASSFYDDAVSRLGGALWHTTATPLIISSGQATVNFPASLLSLLQVIYDDDVLSQLNLNELKGLKTSWRNQPGRPVAFTLDAETAKSAELFPVPNVTPTPIIPVHGLPAGQDYAPGNALAIYSQQVTDVLVYLNLPVALKILEREYSRESNHTDLNFAGFAGMLGDYLFGRLLKDGEATKDASGAPQIELERG